MNPCALIQLPASCARGLVRGKMSVITGKNKTTGGSFMKQWILSVAVAVMALTGVSAMAADLKIAVMDSQVVVNKTNAADRAVKTLKAARDAAQTKINALEAPLVEKQKKLAEQQKVLAPDKFAEAQKAFQQDVAKFRSQAQAIQVDLDKQGVNARKTITDTVKSVVDKIAKERGYDLVVPTAMVFYSSGNVVNITNDVLAETNKMLDK